MLETVSAALASFKAAAKSIVTVRGAISSTVNLLDDGQIDRLKRSIRVIDLFQGDYKSDIDNLLSKSGDKTQVAKSIRDRLATTEGDVKGAIATLNSLGRNLRLSLEEIDAIRNIANIKIGIRQHLRNLVQALESGEQKRVTGGMIRDIKVQIEKICMEIKKIDAALASKGLQNVRA